MLAGAYMRNLNGPENLQRPFGKLKGSRGFEILPDIVNISLSAYALSSQKYC